MKDILIIAHFTQMPGESGNGRFNYIAEKIDKTKSNVEIVTTTFSHAKKSERTEMNGFANLDYKLTMLNEPGYKKNISLKRFYSHYIMGKSLKHYLKKRHKPDVIYCAVPSLDVAKVAANYAKENNIRFIIDIQDLWPEAFKMVFNIPFISNIVFKPMKKVADFVYTSADEIIAVSDTYLKRALEVNKKCRNANSVFLGTELDYFDTLVKSNKPLKKPEDMIWLVYAGTLGHSYDLTTVMDALIILKKQGINNIKFIVMGDGPLKEKFEIYSKEKNLDVEFTGRLEYGKMVGILSMSDIAVNPISPNSAASIINKHADYAAAGLPVLNTQESIEYRELVEAYNMGYNCESRNAKDLSEKLLLVSKDETLRKMMAYNSRRLAEEKFDRKQSYRKIIELIEKCSH